MADAPSNSAAGSPGLHSGQRHALLYAALWHAIVMLRVAYRQVHFGEVLVPADTDALIPRRSTLEVMIDGRYW